MTKSQVLELIYPILAAVATGIAAWISREVNARIKSETVTYELRTLGHAATIAVGAIWQQMVKDLQDPAKPGKWTQEAAREAKRLALTGARSMVPVIVERLTAHGVDVESALNQMIEDSVAKLGFERARSMPPPAMPGAAEVTANDRPSAKR
jgi:hypothetical protein